MHPPAKDRVLKVMQDEAGYGNAVTVTQLEETTGMLRHYVCEALIDLILAEQVRYVGSRCFELAP